MYRSFITRAFFCCVCHKYSQTVPFKSNIILINSGFSSKMNWKLHRLCFDNGTSKIEPKKEKNWTKKIQRTQSITMTNSSLMSFSDFDCQNYVRIRNKLTHTIIQLEKLFIQIKHLKEQRVHWFCHHRKLSHFLLETKMLPQIIFISTDFKRWTFWSKYQIRRFVGIEWKC